VKSFDVFITDFSGKIPYSSESLSISTEYSSIKILLVITATNKSLCEKLK